MRNKQLVIDRDPGFSSPHMASDSTCKKNHKVGRRHAKPGSTQPKIIATSYIWLLNETKVYFLGCTSHISSAQ